MLVWCVCNLCKDWSMVIISKRWLSYINRNWIGWLSSARMGVHFARGELLHMVTFLHEGTILHGDSFARGPLLHKMSLLHKLTLLHGDSFTRRSLLHEGTIFHSVSTEGQFDMRWHFCTKLTFARQDILTRHHLCTDGHFSTRGHFCTTIFLYVETFAWRHLLYDVTFV